MSVSQCAKGVKGSDKLMTLINHIGLGAARSFFLWRSEAWLASRDRSAGASARLTDHLPAG